MLATLTLHAVLHCIVAQQDFEAELKSHFDKTTPELLRYQNRLTLYGESLRSTRPPNETIEQEIELWRRARETDFAKKPSRLLFALCHNLLIYEPETGRQLLEEINHFEYDKQVRAYLAQAALATERWGEAFALRNLESPDLERRRFWTQYLVNYATYEESIPSIRARFENEQDPGIRGGLLRSLAMIGSPESSKFVRQVAETATDDDVQTGAIFAYVELAGHSGIPHAEEIKPVGPKAKSEKEEALKWLKEQTTPESPFGMTVNNDAEFVRRFCDIKSPAMIWLDSKFQTYESAADKIPTTLPAEDKKELLDLLLDTKGFGLEAVKGTLFNCVGREDLELLLKMRAASWYSPNSYSQSRSKTIGILVRRIRKGAS